MPNYLVTYTGSAMPHDPEIMAQAKRAFEEWAQSVGDALVDPGAPVRTITRVASGEPADEVGVNGYSIVRADSGEAVTELLKSHPFVGRGGTLQVNECIGI